MTMQQRIEARLVEALAPARLEVIDESALHNGHAGSRPGGETHYRVVVVSAAFAGRSRVQRHRLVYDALAKEIAERVHALSVDARAPDEP